MHSLKQTVDGATRVMRIPEAVIGWLRLLRAPFAVAMGWAFLITLAQTLVACLLSDGRSFNEAYQRLQHWDGGWYLSIIDKGYFSPAVITPENHGNVAFFPGYPLAAWSLKHALGLSTTVAQLLAAQAACWAFWTYLLLFFARWRLAFRLRVLGVMLVLSHPAAFFLVVPYSESLFLAGVMGFFYWSNSSRRGSRVLAAAPGFVMTATRLVGLPLVAYPFCQVFVGADTEHDADRPWLNRCGRALLLGAVAGLGAVSFFAYCHVRFGAWDTYMKTCHAGWGFTPDYLSMFSLRVLKVHFPLLREKLIDPNFFSRLAVPLALLIFIGLAVVEWRVARAQRDNGWRWRLGLYLCAFLLLYVPVSSYGTRDMTGMVRYALCVQVVLVLVLVDLLRRVWPLELAAERRVIRLSAAWCLICLVLQLLFVYRFVHGLWVA